MLCFLFFCCMHSFPDNDFPHLLSFPFLKGPFSWMHFFGGWSIETFLFLSLFFLFLSRLFAIYACGLRSTVLTFSQPRKQATLSENWLAGPRAETGHFTRGCCSLCDDSWIWEVGNNTWDLSLCEAEPTKKDLESFVLLWRNISSIPLNQSTLLRKNSWEINQSPDISNFSAENG